MIGVPPVVRAGASYRRLCSERRPLGSPLGIHTHMYFQYMCAPYARALPPSRHTCIENTCVRREHWKSPCGRGCIEFIFYGNSFIESMTL